MEYVDTKGRLIKITDQDSDIEAYYQDKCIGSIEFDLEEQVQGTITYLWYMYVDANYQKAGIATEMMRLAVEIHGKNFRRPRFCDVGGSDVRAINTIYKMVRHLFRNVSILEYWTIMVEVIALNRSWG